MKENGSELLVSLKYLLISVRGEENYYHRCCMQFRFRSLGRLQIEFLRNFRRQGRNVIWIFFFSNTFEGDDVVEMIFIAK